ncbi:MAG: hypothetical protein AAGI52_01260 [Bacteroidota bacterium]
MLRSFALLFVLALGGASALSAQPPAFGSADDPLELGASPTSPDRVVVGGYAGPAFLRSGWRTGIRAEATVLHGPFSASIGGAVHPGDGGFYPREADDAYDALRLIRYIRLQPRQGGGSAYARIGPLENATLGAGLLARRYRTTAAWDERRIGAEASIGDPSARVSGFVGDLTGGSVAGAEVEFGTGISVPRVEDLRLSIGAVHDLSLPLSGDSSYTGVEATVQGALFSQDGFEVGPYVSYARLLGRGGAVGVGVEVEAPDLGAVARTHARLGLIVSGGRFIPGHVGPFYSVGAGRQRVVDADSFFDPEAPIAFAGTPIDSANGGVALVTDLRAVAFGRFEGLLYARRHFGPRPLSAFSLRLAARAGDTRFELGLEKQGFRALLSLFGGDLGEENTLVLDIATPVPALSGADLFVRSRYGYRRVSGGDGTDSYLVERRFQPFIGFRHRW